MQPPQPQLQDLLPSPPSLCSPVRTREFDQTGSCLNTNDLRMLVSLYNTAHASNNSSSSARASTSNNSNSSARAKPLVVRASATHDTILRALHRRLGTKRGNEYQWVHLPFVAQDRQLQKSLEDSFRPPMPAAWLQNAYSWLSNKDIELVMKQYDAIVPDYAFLGVVPIDFAARLPNGQCVSTAMCAFDLRKMLAMGKRHFGVVYNLDRHDQTGSHWVCSYASVDPARINFGVYYYDSVAKPPPPEVVAFAAQLKQQVTEIHGAATGARFEFGVNEVRRQYKNTECGVFAMFFLICAMSSKLCFAHICRAMGLDDNVHVLRAVFFRPPARSSQPRP